LRQKPNIFYLSTLIYCFNFRY